MIRLKRFLSLLGFCLALAGVVLENRQVVWGAIGTLVAALALRVYLRHASHRENPAPPRETR